MSFNLKDYILEKIDQRLIFSEYLGISINEIQRCIADGIKISNPLRIDEDPSLSFKWYSDKLIMRDFAERQYRGDIFQIVGIVINCNCRDSKGFVDICSDIIERCTGKNNKIVTDRKEEQRRVNIKQFEIVIESRRANRYDYEFYRKCGILDYQFDQNVQVVDRYYLDDWRSPYRYRTSDPCYAYTVNPNRYKLYFPKRGKRDFKFITNNRSPVECLTTLHETDYIVFIKSYKDKLLFDRMLFDADIHNILVMPFASETITLPKDMFIRISRYVKKGIYALLDLDEAGLKAMQYLKDDFAINPIYFTINTGTKDPTDMCCKYGYDKTFNRFTEIINRIL